MDHLRYALDIAKNNLKIFVPYVALYVGMIVMVVVMFLSMGLNYSSFEEYPEFDPNMFGAGFGSFFLVFFVVIFVVAVLSTPFLQHVYLTATRREEVDFRESFRYATSRFLAFLGADALMVIVFMVVMIAMVVGMVSFFPNYMDFPYEELPYTDPTYHGLIYDVIYRMLPIIAALAIVFVPLGAVFTTALYIMAWDNIGFFDAMRKGFDFIRNRFMKLLALGALLVLISIVLSVIPGASLISFIPNIIVNIAIIDVYLHYKKSKETEPTPIEPT